MIGAFDAAIALPTLRELSEILRFLVWLALVVLLGGILKTIYDADVRSSEQHESESSVGAEECTVDPDTTPETDRES